MNRRPRAEQPGPGQESVWDYPRPPIVERVTDLIQIRFNGHEIIRTTNAKRVLETSHPPNYYLPMEDFMEGCLKRAPGSSICEWKGEAEYFDIEVGTRRASRVAWYYRQPNARFDHLRGHVAVYPQAMDECLVGGEIVRSQPGAFYGGWITDKIVGPFKGEPGTEFW